MGGGGVRSMLRRATGRLAAATNRGEDRQLGVAARCNHRHTTSGGGCTPEGEDEG